MELFYAETLWSGYLRIVTNVAGVLAHGKFVERDDYHLLSVLLDGKAATRLRQYLQGREGNSLEKQLEFAFYCGTPADSWFDLEKFLRVCAEIQITPHLQFYSCAFVADWTPTD